MHIDFGPILDSIRAHVSAEADRVIAELGKPVPEPPVSPPTPPDPDPTPEPEPEPEPDPEPYPPGERPYLDAADWLWDPIPADPDLHEQSGRWAGYLSQGQHVANLDDYGNAIVYADAITSSTPRFSVQVDRTDWGPNPFAGYQVPIPSDALDRIVPFTGHEDSWLIIADPASGKVFHLWQARRVTAGWRATWGGVSDIDGDGRDDITGSGLSNFGGTIRLADLQAAARAGTGLGHALQFSSDATAGGDRADFMFPATKTDGHMGTASPGVTHPIWQGARFQLDPAINVEAISGITEAEKVIARTLQSHGAYLIDNGGARAAFMFERQPGGDLSAYAELGLRWDYYDLARIPWGRLRVLDSWNGGGGSGSSNGTDRGEEEDEDEDREGVFTALTASRVPGDRVRVRWEAAHPVTAAVTIYADGGQWTAPADIGTSGGFEFTEVPLSMEARFVVRFGQESAEIVVPAETVEPTPKPDPPTAPTGAFTVRDGNIFGPDGKRFRAVGTGVGIEQAFDWRGRLPDYRALPALRGWGWNTVKPCTYAPEHMPQTRSEANIDAIVREMTQQGIVVQIVSRDNSDREWFSYSEGATEAQWRRYAQRYQGNPHVWFNLANEPKEANGDWVRYHQRMIDTIRGEGAENMIVIDPPVAGQDVGPEYRGNAYFRDLAPQLRDVGHAVYSPHTYGWAKWQLSRASFIQWVKDHKAMGWPVVVGEFGWTADGSSTAGAYEANRNAGRVTFEAWDEGALDGLVLWHGTHGDMYSTQQNGNAFWEGAHGQGLSELGQMMWERR